MRSRSFNAFLVLAGLFIAALVACNLIVQKFFAFPWPDWIPVVGGSTAVLSVGILPYPLTFLVTDLISEIYGRKRANAVVMVGLVVSVFVVLVIQLAMHVPAMSGRGWTGSWLQAPSQENALTWNQELTLLASPGPEAPAELRLVLPPPEGGATLTSPKALADALNEARKSWEHASDWSFGFESEWAADKSGETGRIRLRLEDVTAKPHVFWEPHSSRKEGTSGDELVFRAEGSGPLLDYLPRGDNRPLPKSPITDSLFNFVFGNTWRAILASMIAYLFAQWFDIQVYHFWKRLTRGRLLWLRNNFSTITSQFLDSALVVTLLFYGEWQNDLIVTAVLSAWVFKMFVALSDTPFLYLGVWLFVRFDLAPEDSEYARMAAERRMARIPTE